MILELKNIYKDYSQGKMVVPVLKDINLTVEEGEYVAIMGPSGSGKTTLMNIIGCLDVPTSGSFLLAGEDLSSAKDSYMAQIRNRSIGFVFQQFNLLPKLTALDNVALPLLYAGVSKKERRELAKEALEKVGLGDRLNFRPNQLSGGQCQRVAIARAIVGRPAILLADEPTGALDSKSGEQVMELFYQLNEEGVTIVMITHEQEIADHAKKIYYLRDGEIVWSEVLQEEEFEEDYPEEEYNSEDEILPEDEDISEEEPSSEEESSIEEEPSAEEEPLIVEEEGEQADE